MPPWVIMNTLETIEDRKYQQGNRKFKICITEKTKNAVFITNRE